MTSDLTLSPFSPWQTEEDWDAHLRGQVPADAADPEGLLRILRRFRPFEWATLGVGRGWDELIIKLNDDLAAIDPGYVVDQVKEKFGGLRYYATPSSGESEVRIDTMLPDGTRQSSFRRVPGSPEFFSLIGEAEERSYGICEDCGAPGGLALSKNGWEYTSCRACAETSGLVMAEDLTEDED